MDSLSEWVVVVVVAGLEEEELLSLSLSVQPAIVKLIKRARASPRAVIFTDFI